MPKENKDIDKKCTRVLYKKSMSKIRTQSGTCSIQPQTTEKNGIQHLKQNPAPDCPYYNDGKKLKRDLSIETDVCIMRNHLRSRINKYSYKEVYSHKSNISTFSIGDSLLLNDRFEAGNSKTMLQNADIMSLVVDNFRALLNKWIREYLFDSSDNIEKIEAIREALVKKLESEVVRVSISTCIFNTTSQHLNCNGPRRRISGPHIAKEVNIFNCEVNCSNYTIPFQSKKCRIVIPSIRKKIHKPSLTCKLKNSTNSILSKGNKPKKPLVDSSTYIMLTMSSKSFNNGDTCSETSEKKSNMPQDLLSQVVKKFLYRKTLIDKPCSSDHLKVHHHCFPETEYGTKSLVQRIYGNLSRNTNRESTVYCLQNHKSTMIKDTSTDLEVGSSDRHVQFLNHNCCFSTKNYIAGISNEIKDKCDKSTKIDKNPLDKMDNLKTTPDCGKRRSNTVPISKKHVTNVDSHKNCNFTYLYRKASKDTKSNNSLVNHIQDVIGHFDTYDGQKEIALNVRVKVLPDVKDQEDLHDFCKRKTTTALINTANCRTLEPLKEFCETESFFTRECNGAESGKEKKIVTLLDGAASKANFIAASESNSFDSADNEFKENVICNQIKSLQCVIQNLTQTAEKLIAEHTRLKERTLSNSTQMDFCPQYTAMINSLRDTHNKNISMNNKYALWFSERPLQQGVPEIMEHMINAELNENYKKETELSLRNTIPDPKILCNCMNSIKDTKPIENKKNNNKSIGIQFTYNFDHGNRGSGFKLQKVSKKTSTLLTTKKHSFTFIDSESVIKVTDMTSKGEAAMESGHINVRSPFPYPPLHVHVFNEKDMRNSSTFIGNREEVSEHDFNYSSYKCDMKRFNDPCPSHIQDTAKSPRKESDLEQNDSMFIIIDDSNHDLKSAKKRQSKFCKIFAFCVLLCSLVLVAAILYATYVKRLEIRPTTETIEVTTRTNLSDLPLLLSDFGL